MLFVFVNMKPYLNDLRHNKDNGQYYVTCSGIWFYNLKKVSKKCLCFQLLNRNHNNDI